MKILRLLVWCGLLLPALVAGEVSVAVASNFLGPLQQLAADFAAAGGDRVRISSGSTGKLYAQIVNGAPYDLFLAANAREPERLEDAGMSVPGRRVTYARGVLALWLPGAAAAAGDDPAALLAADATGRLAIANPRTAPYGAAAQAVLGTWGLLAAYTGRILQGDNVAQAYQYVATGNAAAGFVALSQLLDPGQPPAGRYWRIDTAVYPPIRQQMVLLKRAADNPAALALWQYLTGASVRERIAAFGYALE